MRVMARHQDKAQNSLRQEHNGQQKCKSKAMATSLAGKIHFEYCIFAIQVDLQVMTVCCDCDALEVDDG
jgi:hypothetical protein